MARVPDEEVARWEVGPSELFGTPSDPFAGLVDPTAKYSPEIREALRDPEKGADYVRHNIDPGFTANITREITRSTSTPTTRRRMNSASRSTTSPVSKRRSMKPTPKITLTQLQNGTKAPAPRKSAKSWLRGRNG